MSFDGFSRTIRHFWRGRNLRRVPAHRNLRAEYQVGKYHLFTPSNHAAAYTDKGRFTGLEDDIFQSAELAVPQSQQRPRLPVLLTHLDDDDEPQATAGASNRSDSASSPPSPEFFPASLAPRRTIRPRPANINTAAANTLGQLTGADAVTDARFSAYRPLGQQYLGSGISLPDLQILTRAGNAAREKRRRG